MIHFFRITKYGWFCCALLLFTACQRNANNDNINGQFKDSAPVTEAFKMPKAKPIKWTTFPADSFPKSTTVSMNVDQLPSKPFSFNEVEHLKNPVIPISFNWDGLEKVSVTLGTKAFPLKEDKSLLAKPVVTVAGAPSLWENSTAGIVKLGQAEGLLGNSVYDMVTDSLGNVWIATDRGLVKYNGSEFLSYTLPMDLSAGSAQVINDMTFDPQGRLLLMSRYAGIYRIDLKSNIISFFNTGADPNLLKFTFDNKGKLWCVGSNGWLFLTDLDRRSVYTTDLHTKTPNLTNLLSVYADREGNLWVGGEKGIAIVDPSRKSARILGPKQGLNVKMPFDYVEDANGNNWISSIAKGAYFVSLKNNTIGWLGPKQGVVSEALDIHIDKKQRTWIISNDTVAVYDQHAATLKKIVTKAKLFTTSFPASGMTASDGTIWMGTTDHGILLLNPNGMMDEHFGVNDGLASGDIWGIEEDSKGRMLLATYKGVQIYDSKNKRLSLLKFPEQISVNNNRQITSLGNDIFFLGCYGGFGFLDFPANKMTFYNTRATGVTNMVFAGIKDDDGNLWAVGERGVVVFDFKNKSVKRVDKTGGLPSDLTYVVQKDNQGMIWVVTDKGTSVINPKTNTIQNLNASTNLISDYTSMMLQASNGDIFIGGENGISILSDNLTAITNISTLNGKVIPTVYDMLEVNNQVYLGTANGLVVLNKPASNGKPWHVYNYAKSLGFSFNDYNQSTAFKRANGQTWWAATPELTIINQEPSIDTIAPKVQLKGIHIMDQDPEFTPLAALKKYLKNKDTLTVGKIRYTKGKLPKDTGYFATHGIEWDDITPGTNLPVGLKLPHNQNSLRFSFSSPSVIGKDAVVYRYFLVGKDSNWSRASAKNASLMYYNLPPGDYVFKVVTKGFNEVWGQPAVFSFTILAPWWQTWWAVSSYIILFMVVVYVIVKTRSRMLERENKILEAKVSNRTVQLEKTIKELTATQSQLIHAEKMASLGELTAGIAHEIQNPLNFVNNFAELNLELLGELKAELNESEPDQTVQEELIADISQNLIKINQHGKRADAIVKGMLQHSRASNGTKEAVELNKLADEYLRLAYHGLRAKDKSFNATFKTDFDEQVTKVNMVPQDIGRVIMNLLTNAFYAVNEKKTQLEEVSKGAVSYEPTVSIATRKLATGVEIVVADNGNGIPAAVAEKIFQPFFTTKPTGKGTGLGLSMSYDIVTKGHDGTLTMQTKVRSASSNADEDSGTTFVIFLPF